MTPDDIDRRFSYHPPGTADKQQEHANVRHRCRKLADVLNASLPEGHEKSVAMTKLEEVMFWSNAAIARSGAESTEV